MTNLLGLDVHRASGSWESRSKLFSDSGAPWTPPSTTLQPRKLSPRWGGSPRAPSCSHETREELRPVALLGTLCPALSSFSPAPLLLMPLFLPSSSTVPTACPHKMLNACWPGGWVSSKILSSLL